MTSDAPDQPDLSASREQYKALQADKNEDEEPLQLPVYRVTAKYFHLPIIVSIIFAGALAYLTFYGAKIQITAVPFSEDELGEFGGALSNALFFTIVAAVSSILLYLLVKKRGINALRVILSMTFLFLGVILVIFFGESILIIFSLPLESYYVLLVVAGFTGFSLTYAFHSTKFSNRTKNFVVLTFGILIGAFMGIIMPTWTTMMILMGISIWDIISVRRGPIKKIFQLYDPELQTKEDETLASKQDLSKEDFLEASMEIGIGDIAFYSLLASHALISTNSFLVWGFTIIGILIGAAWTLRLIRRNKILPGLPLSIFIGVGLYWIGVYIDSLLAPFFQ